MSTNYYLHTPDGTEVHLGQFAAESFTFRADPDRGVDSYEAWLAQLDGGVIRTEYGKEVTREEMVTIADRRHRFCYSPHFGIQWGQRVGFEDAEGRRFYSIDFC